MSYITKIQVLFSKRDCIYESIFITFVVLMSMIGSIPAYCQFTDVTKDTKTVDIGVAGDTVHQTLTLTAVVPVANINGWAGFFGSRVSSDEGVLSEILKFHVESGINFQKVEIEAFSYFERNLTDGSELTAQLGGTIQPANYEKGSFSITANFGYFLETIRPFEETKFRHFDPTAFRWLVSSTVDWHKINTELKFTPEIGFKNYRICAEPTVTFDLTNRFGLKLSGTFNYNSEPLTDNLQYYYLSILRIRL